MFSMEVVMRRIFLSAGLALLALAPVAHAQQGGAAAVPASDALEVMLLKISASSRCPDGCAVRGLPYSAQRVTESVKVLADGNRIVQRHAEKLYRDSDGRTREESEWKGKPLVQIQDPVAGMSYRLYPDTKTGYRMAIAAPAPVATPTASGAAVTGSTAGAAGAMRMAEQLSPALAAGTAAATTQTRSLGTKQIDGMTAEGTQATMTTPAGAIGNVLPMVSTTETWVARELRLPILLKIDHPFMGESVTRLQDISRLEPPTALFAVPADYTVRDVARR
jgi:hypothetical protein